MLIHDYIHNNTSKIKLPVGTLQCFKEKIYKAFEKSRGSWSHFFFFVRVAHVINV